MSLYDVYVERMMEGEYFTLPEFMDRVQAGEFGKVTRAEAIEFLRRVELDILGNIETMISAHGGLAEQREERIEETKQMIQDLIDRFREPGT